MCVHDSTSCIDTPWQDTVEDSTWYPGTVYSSIRTKFSMYTSHGTVRAGQ
jgi:hypothetical protein